MYTCSNWWLHLHIHCPLSKIVLHRMNLSMPLHKNVCVACLNGMNNLHFYRFDENRFWCLRCVCPYSAKMAMPISSLFMITQWNTSKILLYVRINSQEKKENKSIGESEIRATLEIKNRHFYREKKMCPHWKWKTMSPCILLWFIRIARRVLGWASRKNWDKWKRFAVNVFLFDLSQKKAIPMWTSCFDIQWRWAKNQWKKKPVEDESSERLV